MIALGLLLHYVRSPSILENTLKFIVELFQRLAPLVRRSGSRCPPGVIGPLPHCRGATCDRFCVRRMKVYR